MSRVFYGTSITAPLRTARRGPSLAELDKAWKLKLWAKRRRVVISV